MGRHPHAVNPARAREGVGVSNPYRRPTPKPLWCPRTEFFLLRRKFKRHLNRRSDQGDEGRRHARDETKIRQNGLLRGDDGKRLDT